MLQTVAVITLERMTSLADSVSPDAPSGVLRIDALFVRLRVSLSVLTVAAAAGVALGVWWLHARGALGPQEARELAGLLLVIAVAFGATVHWILRTAHRVVGSALVQLEQDRAQAEAQWRLRARVSEIGAQLQQAQDPAALAQVLLSALARQLPCHQALCCLWDEQAASLEAAARYGGPGAEVREVMTRVPRLGTLVGECAARREPVLIRGEAASFLPIGSGLGEARASAVVLYPMQHGGRLFAVLELATLSPFGDEQMQLLREIEPVFSMGLDILQRSARAERLLAQTQATEARSRLILDAVSEGIWGIDLEGRTTFVNRSALELLGYEEAEVMGHVMHDRVHARRPDGSDYPAAECPMHQTLADGCQRQVDDEVLWHKSGRPVPVNYVVTAISESGAVTGAVIVFRDTSRERAEIDALARAGREAQEATRMKAAMLANMSREVRVAMNAVVGMSHMLLRSGLTERQRVAVQRVQASGRHLLGMVNDMVDFARLEQGTLLIEAEAFSLSGLLAWLGNAMRERIELKGLAWRTEIETDVPDRVVGDRRHLGQVLANYCDNAVKFTASGTVTVGVRREPSDGQRLRFEVRDTGLGLTPAQQAHLFDSLASSTETTREDGSAGLGLVMARTLVEMMGGEFGVQSSPGDGSTFWFAIDLPAAPVAEVAREGVANAVTPGDLKGARVLVVDDDPIDQAVAAELLGDAGFEVQQADHGQQALDLLAAHRFDLVFMDIRMPVLDGLSATAALRRLPGCSELPVIAMTANVMPEDIEHCRAAGMNDWLAKPLEPDSLVRMVVKWVRPATEGAAP
jgi:PAS domain S-box-containing protein